jgi:hypothetical protein
LFNFKHFNGFFSSFIMAAPCVPVDGLVIFSQPKPKVHPLVKKKNGATTTTKKWKSPPPAANPLHRRHCTLLHFFPPPPFVSFLQPKPNQAETGPNSFPSGLDLSPLLISPNNKAPLLSKQIGFYHFRISS